MDCHQRHLLLCMQRNPIIRLNELHGGSNVLIPLPLGNWHRHSVATPESLTQDVRPQQALNEDVGEEFPIFQNGGAKK